MANITTCARCGGLYEAGSDEQANEPGRTCRACHVASAMAEASFAMERAACAMRHHGGDRYEQHAAELMGAAGIVAEWLREIGQEG